MKLKPVLMALAVTALIGLSACGGDDDEEPEAGTTATEAPTTTAGGDGGGGGGGASSSIEINADPGGGLAFEESSLETKAGEVTVEFYNDASLGHDVRFEDADGNDVGGTSVITEDEEETTIDLEAGDYTFFCSVSGHREGGMEGTLTVE